MNRLHGCTVMAGVMLAAGGLAGCGRDEDQPQYREIEGRVAGINTQTGEVSMWWYSEKRKEEILLPGKLAPNAEILIDGRTAELSDVFVDDRVRVRGTVVSSGDDKQLIANSVEVSRQGTRPSTGPSERPDPDTQPAS